MYPNRQMHRFVVLLARLSFALLVLAGCQTADQSPPPARAVRVIEPDLRTPKKADTPPPPIQGGSLLALVDGKHVVVGDADRHRVLGVSLEASSVLFEHDVGKGSLPGRMAADGAGLVHVVLRGSGELLTLEPTTGDLVRREPVCGEPRGLAYDMHRDLLHLACADGELWTLDPDNGEVQHRQFIATDLRDVAMTPGGGMHVSTFREARLFEISPDGEISSLPPLPSSSVTRQHKSGELLEHSLSANAAWRLVSSRSGATVVVHQRADEGEIEIEPHDPEDIEEEPEAETVVQPIEDPQGGPPSGGGSSYGGGGGGPGSTLPDCSSIVHSALTVVDERELRRTSAPLSDTVLPVDVAISPDGNQIAFVAAGPRDPEAPTPVVEFRGDRPLPGLGGGECVGCVGPSTLKLLELSDISSATPGGCLHAFSSLPIPEPTVSVTYVPNRPWVLAQAREPSRLYVVHTDRREVLGRIELGGASVADTGHDLFHRDSGGGIACASCHLEGAEDAHTWLFSGLGPRRTQPLNVRLRGTAPFHWDGTMPTLGAIMSEVFVGRMGGAPQSPERLEALNEWVTDLDPPAPVRPEMDDAAERGKALFEDEEVGCQKCHSGKKLTNNTTVDVGTSEGVPLQVPSLLGVAHRTPLMHDGCARTLAERFEPDCGGGDDHGKTSHLTDEEIDDLVAYLETL